MSWVIHKDLPYFGRTLDDRSAAIAYEESVVVGDDDIRRSEWTVGRATTIYFPTHLAPQLQSEKGRVALISGIRCATPYYWEAVDYMEEAFLIYHAAQVHWALFHLTKEDSTLKVIDTHEPPLATKEDGFKFLTFLSCLLNDPKYLKYTIQLISPSTEPSLPHQRDSVSCGVFASVLAYHLMKRAKIHFSQDDIQLWRAFMLQCILSLAGDA